MDNNPPPPPPPPPSSTSTSAAPAAAAPNPPTSTPTTTSPHPPPTQSTQLPQTQPLTPDSPAIIDLATRLYTAARAGDIPTLSAALSAGLPPNLTNSDGNTLLMLATYHGHAELARILLAHGADPNRLNDRGQSPLAGALFKGEDEVVEVLLQHCGATGMVTGYADVDIGHPSAWDCMTLFRKEEAWHAKFEQQRSKIVAARGGLGGGGEVWREGEGGGGGGEGGGKGEKGVGGVKEGFEMV